MKVIIAGSRDFNIPVESVSAAVEVSTLLVAEVVCGMAEGADLAGRRWAKQAGVPVKEFPVTKEMYELYQRRAPMMRNIAMADYADALIAIWDGESRGTRHMIKEMERREKPYCCIIVTEEDVKVCMNTL